MSTLAEVRDFLDSLRRELPELFRPPARSKPRGAPRPDLSTDSVRTESVDNRRPVTVSRQGEAPCASVDCGPLSDVRGLFESRVKHWSSLMGVSPRRIFLKNQRSLWGSCSTRGNLNFNRVLASAPPEILDYVVIHELAHLKEMNHSRRFWAVVEAWCPEQKQRRRWLRRNVSLLRPLSPRS